MIHERSPATLKIMLTGQADVEAVGNAVNEAKLYRFIAKPWHREDMALTVSEAVRAYVQARRIEEQNEELRRLNVDLEVKVTEQEKTLRLFQRYVPKPVVEKALAATEESILDGELRNVAVIFCDIRDFTSLSEELGPKEVVTFLNDYYGVMTEVVMRHQGAVNQFVGDEVFATFGAPVVTDNNELNAARCALEMAASMHGLNDKYAKVFGREVQVGIGVNAGPVVAGNAGSETRIEYSVLGDTVNTGKRIESLTKDMPGPVLISNSVYQSIKDAVEVEAMDPVFVKGKKERLQVYRLSSCR